MENELADGGVELTKDEQAALHLEGRGHSPLLWLETFSPSAQLDSLFSRSPVESYYLA